MIIDPRHFRIVRAIIEHGTFNRAADALGVSQPALSKSIAQLEKSLGAKLFERGKRGTRPTEAGLLAARGATNIEWAIRHSQAEIRASAEGVLGPLVIGATPSMTLGLLPRALGQLARTYPNASATIVEGLENMLLPALDRGEIELLIGPVDPLCPISNRIVEVALASEPFLVGLPFNHRLSERPELAISELADEPWILPTVGSSFYRVVEAMFLASGKRMPLNAINSNSLAMQELLVPATGRICLVTPAQLLGRPASFKVTRLANAPTREIGVRYRAAINLSATMLKLIDHLQELAKDLGYSPEPIPGRS